MQAQIIEGMCPKCKIHTSKYYGAGCCPYCGYRKPSILRLVIPVMTLVAAITIVVMW
jgi:hypothetical protein